MPEYPDVTVYVNAVARRVVGQPLEHLRVASPFVLRTFDPPAKALEGKVVTGVRRLGKRVVLALRDERDGSASRSADDDLFAVVHLMIAGRLHWKEAGAKIPGKVGLLAFDFPNGSLTLTEAGTKKRASLHLVRGEAALAAIDRGGIEVMGASRAEFAAALRRENHTLKRTLTDPRLFSAIGNAYSDEILHLARLSPIRLSQQMTEEEIDRLYAATHASLTEWTERLEAEAKDAFPEKVTAFRPEMAVHGKYGKPCPVCGDPVQRIVHAENETNYCATCQTGGKLLADRALSRLLKSDWPRTFEELEEHRSARREPGPDAVVGAPRAAAPAATGAPAAGPAPKVAAPPPAPAAGAGSSAAAARPGRTRRPAR